MLVSSNVTKVTIETLLGGYACTTAGLPEPDLPCQRGYYCEYGVDTETPLDGSGNKGVGDICPAGSYCPEGSPAPTPSPAGSYTSTTGNKCGG